jgi:hypothetical protein
MSLRVFAWDANPTVDPFLYRLSNNRAQELVDEDRAEFVQLADGRRGVQLVASYEEKTAKSVGHNNLVPFGRTYNPMMAPPSLHYEIPRAGDGRTMCAARFGLRRQRIPSVVSAQVLTTRVLRVSSRKIDLTAASYLAPAGVLRNSIGQSPSAISV